MAKPAKTDRQAKIDQIRNKQKGAERRRGFMIVGVCAVIALLIVGRRGLPARSRTGGSCASSSSSTSPRSVLPPTGVPGHQDQARRAAARTTSSRAQPIPYKDAPPAFGPHWNDRSAPAPIERKLYTEATVPTLG